MCCLHKEYLERIINIQDEEIKHLKSLVINSSSQQRISPKKEIKEIKHSIFDIIHQKVEELEIKELLSKIDRGYPANDSVVDLIFQLVTYDCETLFVKENSNLIKYMDTENVLMYNDHDMFGKMICEHIFLKLKPMVETRIESIDENDELDYDKNTTVLKT